VNDDWHVLCGQIAHETLNHSCARHIDGLTVKLFRLQVSVVYDLDTAS